jgi:hypothetical protein
MRVLDAPGRHGFMPREPSDHPGGPGSSAKTSLGLINASQPHERFAPALTTR